MYLEITGTALWLGLSFYVVLVRVNQLCAFGIIRSVQEKFSGGRYDEREA